MGNTSNIYFFEGENERYFIESLIEQKLILPGQKTKHNFWNNKVDQIIQRLKKSEKYNFFIIYDTDTLDGKEKFVNNINKLAKQKHKIILLQQTNNFEDEISYCMGDIGKKDLYLIFGSCSDSEFKKNFNGTTNKYQKLKNNNFEYTKMYSRDLHDTLKIMNFEKNVIFGKMESLKPKN